MCGEDREQALANLRLLERLTAPQPEFHLPGTVGAGRSSAHPSLEGRAFRLGQ